MMKILERLRQTKTIRGDAQFWGKVNRVIVDYKARGISISVNALVIKLLGKWLEKPEWEGKSG